jgi:hypothetical protein
MAAQGMLLVNPLSKARTAFGFGLLRLLRSACISASPFSQRRILNQLSEKQTLLRV